MIQYNTPQSYGGKVLAYLMLKAVVISVIIALIAVAFISHGVSSNGGVAVIWEQKLPWLRILPYAIVALTIIFTYAYFKIFQYTIFKDHIVIRSGVILVNTKSLDFNKFQNIDSAFGPILAMFGLRKLVGFTSSPGQFQIESTANGVTTKRVPDLQFYIDKNSAQEFLALIQQGDVQKVQSVNQ